MEYEIHWKRVFVLLGFVLVLSGFGLNFVLTSEPTHLTGYVVLEEGVRVSTEKLDPALVKELKEGNTENKVVIILEDTAGTTSPNEQRQQDAIDDVQEEFIDDLENDIDVEVETISTLEHKEADLIITKEFESTNAVAGEILTGDALVELAHNNDVKKIMLDYPVELVLDGSINELNAPSLHTLGITGKHNSVCIIDTGVDYTHNAFDNCDAQTFQLTGQTTLLNDLVQSEHPYGNNEETTFTIHKPGYTNIAVHFTNLTLEEINGNADTTDRIYILDGNNATIAVYKGEHSSFWTPSVAGDTMHIRLVTDGSVTRDGFVIDQVINGTTNVTMDWSSCSRVAGGWDTYHDDANPLDDHGHGTHVAGIALSQNDTYKGVAPSASVVAVKAISANGKGYASDVLAGIEYCTSNAKRLNISVISMSLACGGNSCVHYQETCNGDLLAPSITKAAQQNISVVVATGNSGWTDGVASPSCAPDAIPVGGSNGNSIIYNRGRLLTLLAPAVSIKSSYPNERWVSLSGTSMSTPHVAGAAAVLQQFFREEVGRAITPAEVQTRFAETGFLVQDGGSGLNFSKLNLLAAVTPRLTVQLENGSIQNTSLTINGTADLPLSSSILQMTYPNGTVVNHSMTTSKYTYSVTRENLMEGIYSFIVITNSTKGLESRVARSFTVDVSSSVTLHSPVANSFYPGAVLVNITAQHSNSTTILITNASVVHNITTNATYTNSFSLGEGVYTISVRVPNETITHNFTVDMIAPEIHNITYTSDVDEHDNITVHINTSDTYLATIFVESNISGTMINYSAANGAYSFSSSLYNASDVLWFKGYSRDKAGNTANSSLYSITIQQGELIGSPLNNTVVELGSNVTFAAASGFSNYTWLFDDDTSLSGQSVSKMLSIGMHDTVLTTATRNGSVIVRVNDTQPPSILDSSYDNEFHSQADGTQNISVTVHDYSAITLMQIQYGETTTNSTCVHNICSWHLTDLTDGEFEFSVKTSDVHGNTRVTSYDFEVQSCADETRNGDETGVDCGGSCNACPEATAEAAPSSSGGGGGGGGSSSSSSRSRASEPIVPKTPQILEIQEAEQVQEVSAEVQEDPKTPEPDLAEPVQADVIVEERSNTLWYGLWAGIALLTLVAAFSVRTKKRRKKV